MKLQPTLAPSSSAQLVSCRPSQCDQVDRWDFWSEALSCSVDVTPDMRREPTANAVNELMAARGCSAARTRRPQPPTRPLQPMSSMAWLPRRRPRLLGTLEQLDVLTEHLHARDMKLVMDLVVNHISSAHAWFVKSRSSIDKLNARPPSKGPRSGVVSAKGSVPRLYLLCVIWAFRRLRRCNPDLTSAPAANTAPISRPCSPMPLH